MNSVWLRSELVLGREYRVWERVVSGLTYSRMQRELYLDWYILKNTERVISGLIHIQEYGVSCIWIDTYSRIQKELYLNWYILKNTKSCIWIDTYLRIQRELYLDWYILKITERVVPGLIQSWSNIGVRHLIH